MVKRDRNTAITHGGHVHKDVIRDQFCYNFDLCVIDA